MANLQKKIFYCFFFLAVMVVPNLLQADDHKPIKLLLKWKHQFQFAGFYAAQIKGYYQQSGLEVEILEAIKGKKPTKLLLDDTVQVAISDATNILINKSNGAPIRSIGVIFQESPYAMMSFAEKNLKRPSDLIGKKVGLSTDAARGDFIFTTLFKAEGLDINKVKRFEPTWNSYKKLPTGEADAISGYITNEAITLENMGYKLNIIRPSDYGIALYGDTMFTRSSFVDQNPELVTAFLDATAKGWEYAFKNRGEIAEYILTLDGVKERGKTKELLLQEADAMKRLVLPDLVKVGHQSEFRWQHIYYLMQGYSPEFTSKELDTKEFVFDPNRSSMQQIQKSLWVSLIVIALGMFLGFCVFYVMKEIIKRRTNQLLEKSRELERLLEKEKELKEIANEAVSVHNRFLANVSHEMRTPLTAISGFCELIQENSKDKNILPDLRVIDERASYLNDLVGSLISMSKGKSLEIKLSEWKSGSVVHAIQDTLTPLKVLAENQGLNIEFQPQVDADRSFVFPQTEFKRIVENLVSNSIKYSAKGSIKVNLQCTQNDTLKLIVSDEGKGISETDKKEIFTPFFRSDSAKEMTGSGIGLGLTIVKQLVELMNATIKVENNEPKGTRFIVEFLFDKEKADQNLKPVESGNNSSEDATDSKELKKDLADDIEKVSKMNLHVLVVDDQPLNLKLLTRMIQKLNCTFDSACNGFDALKMVNSVHTFDIILCDLNMPVMTGQEFVKELKSDPSNPTTPVIAVSAANTEATIEECKILGFNGFLAKPINKKRLVSVLMGLVKESQSQSDSFMHYKIY